jgi:hypothetical protein
MAAGAVWALVRFTSLGASRQSVSQLPIPPRALTWSEAVEKVRADRGEVAGGSVETPPELRHYSERYWFLATQVAEIEKYNVHLCQDFFDLADLIQRGEIVPIPAVTDSYVLYGVGEASDDAEFSRFEGDGSAELNESLQTLAKNFAGRSYDLNNPSDRQRMKIDMLSALRPQALQIMEAVASGYHRQFDRPLPVSSLIRPEKYQHALRKVNRNATLIETPPHSTGLAFDIDYRYMSAAEQTFVMNELARLEQEGRIEVIRERNANYHVFAFVNATRPSDQLIRASLEKAGAPVQQAHHAKVAKPRQKAKSRTTKPRRPRANVRKRRR